MRSRLSLSLALLGSAALLSSAALIGCDLEAFFLKPKAPFDASKLAAPPDYSQPATWAARPDMKDRADFVPPGVADTQADAPADVFYIHPTTWFNLEVWNDTFDDPKSLEVVDQITLAGEASAFNGCCQVYAPRYRQTTIGAFYGELGDAQQSIAIAYEDIDRAFTAFLAETGDRPFIIAGHSQGSQNAMRLLERVSADEALRERLVAAYAVGFAHPLSNFETAYPELEPCVLPEQLGCVAAWDTYEEGAKAEGDGPMLHWAGDALAQLGDAPRQCTNPVTWRGNTAASEPAAHRGAVAPVNTGNPVDMRKLLMGDDPLGVSMDALGEPRAGWLTARCEGDVLRVPDVSKLDWPATEVQPGNYHLMDYELFYMDIRENAIARTDAWLARQAAAKASLEKAEAAEAAGATPAPTESGTE